MLLVLFVEVLFILIPDARPVAIAASNIMTLHLGCLEDVMAELMPSVPSDEDLGELL